MVDPYYRYPAAAAADRGSSISRPSFPGYLSSEKPSLASHHADTQVASSDVQKRDVRHFYYYIIFLNNFGIVSLNVPSFSLAFFMHINQLQLGIYGMNDISNSGFYPEPNLGGLSAGATIRAYPSSLGDPSLGAQRWDASVGTSSSVGVYPEPNFGGVSAGASIREVPNLVGHRWDAPSINPSAGVHPESSFGAVSAAATVRGYSSPLEIPNLVGLRRDVRVGISPSSGLHPETSLGAVSAGVNIKGYPSPREDSTLVGQRKDSPLGMKPGIRDAFDEKPASMRNGDGHAVAAGESNILFVDGLPTDCTRREVGHLFRPFTGYKEIKVIHKEPRHSGDRAMVLCFVEFDDSRCAMTAMGALQGYKFDDKKPDSSALRIQFAHFPFRLRANRDDQRVEF